ncbi:NF-X1 type Zn finger-containing protein [Histoplasma capsulatum H143]|uniref:NF-X1 type Zn finger-containing protein n=1 Tax=Ajellomyces capsulatus (strain H143) TaxID=544712 RepID=C6HS29_AJECH|nr:NF-X1 type Zn finger-containing protein [Histoplasma capsulatum H143]
MNCGRHTCGEHCCPGERKAIERQATKRKLKSLNVANRPNDHDIEAEHICTRVCGRLLKCSKHMCQELCHKGSCASTLPLRLREAEIMWTSTNIAQLSH